MVDRISRHLYTRGLSVIISVCGHESLVCEGELEKLRSAVFLFIICSVSFIKTFVFSYIIADAYVVLVRCESGQLPVSRIQHHYDMGSDGNLPGSGCPCSIVRGHEDLSDSFTRKQDKICI